MDTTKKPELTIPLTKKNQLEFKSKFSLNLKVNSA